MPILPRVAPLQTQQIDIQHYPFAVSGQHHTVQQHHSVVPVTVQEIKRPQYEFGLIACAGG
jgi:hypothetical protein